MREGQVANPNPDPKPNPNPNPNTNRNRNRNPNRNHNPNPKQVVCKRRGADDSLAVLGPLDCFGESALHEDTAQANPKPNNPNNLTHTSSRTRTVTRRRPPIPTLTTLTTLTI